MTSTTAPKTLVQHIRLKAPAARVYRALTDSQELQKWFPDVAAVDARVGGEWRYEFVREGGNHVTYGRFLALVPNEKVSYNWYEGLDEDDTVLGNFTVVFRLVPDGDETDLYLEETGYLGDELHDAMFGRRTNGWSYFLGNLASYLAGGPDLRLED